MKRICFFAGYDSEGIIHDYVVYYIKELSKVSDVYYMADNEVSDEEKRKISPYVKAVYGFNHKKYDFGSWQELIKITGWDKISGYDELILANDSVFGPLYPITDLLYKIEADKEWDMCGISQGIYRNNHERIRHIQSYFLIIKITSSMLESLNKFFNQIKIEDSYINVVEKYEVGFSQFLEHNQHSLKTILDNKYDFYNDFKTCLKNGSPFIKVKTILNGVNNFKHQESFYQLENTLCTQYNYESELISSYMYSKRQYRLDIYNQKKYKIRGILNSIKQVRKNIIDIKFSKKRDLIRIFGIILLSRPKAYKIIKVI